MNKVHKLKVLLVSPYSSKKVGGIGTWSKNIIDYVAKRDDISFKFQNTATWFKGNLHVNIVSRVFIGIIDSFLILVRLFFNMVCFKPDVVHCTSSASLGLTKDRIAIDIVTKIFKRKFIIHWRFGRIPELCKLRNSEYRKLIKVINKASVSIVIDKKSLESLKSLGINNLVNIPNPISEDLEKLTINSNNTHLRNFGEIVFAGHIIPTKGVYELVRACTEIPSVKKLIMIGPVFSEVKEQLMKISLNRDNGNWLEFKGELKRNDVIKYLQKANILCLPSYSEGFPNIILEAMACACPIIATSVGAIPEMLDNGAGICIDVKDEKQLIKEIEELIKDNVLAIEIGKTAQEKVLRDYTLNKIFEQYHNLWNNK